MAFFNSAVTVLQTLVIALGAGLGIWGSDQPAGRLRQRQPWCQVSGHEAADGWRRRGTDRHDSGAAAFWTFWLNRKHTRLEF